MGQEKGEESIPSPVVRAEQLVDRTEQRIKSFLANAGQRVQHTASSVREDINQTGQPSAAQQEQHDFSATPQAEGTEQPVMERAEKMADSMGQRIGVWTSIAAPPIMRVTARMREGAEDIWAEAQQIRHSRTRQ
jgi:vacuolar-type H+-ATPase subunit H